MDFEVISLLDFSFGCLLNVWIFMSWNPNHLTLDSDN